jgi:hypothetical protein
MVGPKGHMERLERESMRSRLGLKDHVTQLLWGQVSSAPSLPQFTTLILLSKAFSPGGGISRDRALPSGRDHG